MPKTVSTHTKQVVKTGQYGTIFRQRLRITNFAPYGSDPKMQINAEDYNKYKRVFEDIFIKEDWKLFTIQNALYKNYQFLVRLPDCETVDEAFERVKRLKDIVKEADIAINDRELKVTLEPDDERKAWLITFFSSFRAVEKFADKAVGGNFHP